MRCKNAGSREWCVDKICLIAWRRMVVSLLYPLQNRCQSKRARARDRRWARRWVSFVVMSLKIGHVENLDQKSNELEHTQGPSRCQSPQSNCPVFGTLQNPENIAPKKVQKYPRGTYAAKEYKLDKLTARVRPVQQQRRVMTKSSGMTKCRKWVQTANSQSRGKMPVRSRAAR